MSFCRRVVYRPEATDPVRQLRPGGVSKSTSYRSSLTRCCRLNFTVLRRAVTHNWSFPCYIYSPGVARQIQGNYIAQLPLFVLATL